MIQELISTSAPRCLDGNAGFGIVAQTQGMAPNVSQVANALSGYSHIATPGSVKNPVIYLHAIRRTGGMLLHIVSRVADCGNDYSGRSNRIAHHWIIEEGDIRSLPGGPAELTTQNIFRSQWTEKPTVLPHKELSSTDVLAKKCIAWEQMTGDAGWGGVVAERAEKGDPISIIFTPEHSGIHLRTLIGESLGLLPSSVRWGITFCTYSMKSHEAGGGKIQIKCFLAGTEESQFARQSPNTLVIDLQQSQGAAPAGKYVEWARGTAQPPPMVPTVGTSAPSDSALRDVLAHVASKKSKSHVEEVFYVERIGNQHYTKPKSKNWEIYLSHGLLILLVLGLGVGLWQKNGELARTRDIRDAIQNALGTEQVERDVIQGELKVTRNRLETTQCTLATREDELQAAQTEAQNNKEEYENELSKSNNAKIESKRRAIAYNLSQIPARWDGLKSHSEQSHNEFFLPNSAFLHVFRDDVKIEYIPFVNLKNPKTHENISDVMFDVEYDDSTLPIIFKLSYKFPDGDIDKDKNDEPIMDEYTDPVMKPIVGSKSFEIAKIELTNEGLQFIWQDGIDNRETEAWHYAEDDAWFRIKNRILLAKLKISLDNDSRMIDLWTPDSIVNTPSAQIPITSSVIVDDANYYIAESIETRTSSPFQLIQMRYQTPNLDAETNKRVSRLAFPPPQSRILIHTYLLKLGVDSPKTPDDLLLFRESK